MRPQGIAASSNAQAHLGPIHWAELWDTVARDQGSNQFQRPDLLFLVGAATSRLALLSSVQLVLVRVPSTGAGRGTRFYTPPSHVYIQEATLTQHTTPETLGASPPKRYQLL